MGLTFGAAAEARAAPASTAAAAVKASRRVTWAILIHSLCPHVIAASASIDAVLGDLGTGLNASMLHDLFCGRRQAPTLHMLIVRGEIPVVLVPRAAHLAFGVPVVDGPVVSTDAQRPVIVL